jgi:hypothetical protein
VAAETKIDPVDLRLLHLTDDPAEAVRMIVEAEEQARRGAPARVAPD